MCSRETIKADLTTERPSYALSCYAPGKNELNIFGGDLSPEELRLQYYAARNAGNASLYVRTSQKTRAYAAGAN